MPNYANDSRSRSEEQWTLVNSPQEEISAESHAWRMVWFKNGRDELRPGLKCDWCNAVKIMSREQVRQVKNPPPRW